MNDESRIKNDINFLEYPLWVLGCSNKSELTIEKTGKGSYQILSGRKLPTNSDIMVLYFLLSKAFSNSTMLYSTEVTTSRYEIAKNVHGNRNNFLYRRIKESLHRWTSVSIHFEGLLYDGVKHRSGAFHFIDSFHVEEETGELKVRFNHEYISHLNTSQYYRRFSFDELKKIKRPVSRRLYEIFLKFDSKPVTIGTKKLAEKITLSEIYPSQIIKKIFPAIREINRSGLLSIGCTVGTDRNGESVLTFSCGKGKLEDPAATNPYLVLVSPENRNTSVRRILKRFAGDPNLLMSNILFANRNAKRNYAGYLRKALEENWAQSSMPGKYALRKKFERQISEAIPRIVDSLDLAETSIAEYLAVEAAEDLLHVIDQKLISPEFLISKVLSYGLKPNE